MKKLNTTIKVGLLGISLYATEMLGGDYRLGDIQIPDGFSVYSQQKLKKEMGLEEAREALAESCLRQAEWNRNFLGSLKDGTLELKSEDIEAFLRQYDIDVNKLDDEAKQNITIFLACGLDKEVVMAASSVEWRGLRYALFKGTYYLDRLLTYSADRLIANAIENQLVERLFFSECRGRICRRYFSESFFKALCFSTTIRVLDIWDPGIICYGLELSMALRFNKSVTSISLMKRPKMSMIYDTLAFNDTIQELEIDVDDDQIAFELSGGIGHNRSLKKVVLNIGMCVTEGAKKALADALKNRGITDFEL